MVGIGRITFDCRHIVTATDDDNGEFISISFQYLNCSISRTECQKKTKKICREPCLGPL